MTLLLEARNLSVTVPDRAKQTLFGAPATRTIVHDIDLSLSRGDALGLVGESGSGKTTLGRALLRLIPVAAGTLRFDGTDITHADAHTLRPLRARMQMIFQDPQASLNPRLRVATSLTRPETTHGRLTQPRMARAEELLEMVGLPPALASRHPQALSGGQRQRVGIARALALRPDLVVADEVVSGLDVSSQAAILALLRDLRARLGLTLVFISHDLAVVRALCDRVAVLRAGTIVEHGPCADLFTRPTHRYTQELLAAVPSPDPDPHWLD